MKVVVNNKFNLVFASLFFSLMTVCVKKIDETIPIYELVFFIQSSSDSIDIPNSLAFFALLPGFFPTIT